MPWLFYLLDKSINSDSISTQIGIVCLYYSHTVCILKIYNPFLTLLMSLVTGTIGFRYYYILWKLEYIICTKSAEVEYWRSWNSLFDGDFNLVIIAFTVLNADTIGFRWDHLVGMYILNLVLKSKFLHCSRTIKKLTIWQSQI